MCEICLKLSVLVFFIKDKLKAFDDLTSKKVYEGLFLDM